MKKQTLIIMLTMLLCMVSGQVSAEEYYDYAIQNSDGVTIYYNVTNNNTEAEVTYMILSLGSNKNKDAYSDIVNIPESITINGNTLKVTSISDYAFMSCNNLISVTIPKSVISIGNYAFAYCESLTSLNIPNGVTCIGEWTFAYCSSLTSMTIPEGVTDIGHYAFLNCSGLQSLSIPNSVTNIGNFAFSHCSGLTSLNIPNGVTRIGNSTFDYCRGLKFFSIPNSVTSIGNSAFAYCSGLTSLSIPNSVTKIDQGAFSNCSNLISLTIPNSVIEIAYAAFEGCNSLTSFVSLIKEPFKTSAFSYISANPTLYIPQGTKDKYIETTGWNVFSNIIESGASTNIDITDESGLATYCPEVGVDFSNSPIAAYKASVEGSTIILAKVDKVAAGEGVLLRSLNGGAINTTVDIHIEAEKNENNAFVGTLTATTLKEKDDDVTNFVLFKKNGVVGFYKANNTPIAAGKAYLPIENYNAEADARGLTLVFDDGNTTSISEIDNATTADNAVYTLSGARVKNPAKGVYIKNGKKVIVK